MGGCLEKAADQYAAGQAGTTEELAAAGKAAGDAPAGAKGWNHALVFIKPHAANDKVRELVKDMLAKSGVEVLEEGRLGGAEIDEKGIIDSHYAHIAKIAMEADAATLPVADEKKEAFAETFGKGSWDDLAAAGQIRNLKQLQDSSGLGAGELEALWRDSKTFKLAPGTYVGYIESQECFALNAFYGSMREVYTTPSAEVLFFTVRFAEADLCWKDFRGKVIGATDPSKAVAGSVRAKILADYEALGLADAPDMGQNGVHASAGPIEGLRERMVWLSQTLDADPFGKQLLERVPDRALIDLWLLNERVTIAGETDNAFDLLEDKDSSVVLDLLAASS